MASSFLESGDWPTAEEITLLSENHRRGIAAALRTLARRLRELDVSGQAAVPREAILGLERTMEATDIPEPELEPLSLVAALRVMVDDLDPMRMRRYGPLDPDQERVLRHLAEALGRLLDTVEPGNRPADSVRLRPIGVVRSPFRQQRGTPIQPGQGRPVEGRIVIDAPFVPALEDLDGFERLWILSWLDRARDWRPHVRPYRDDSLHGLFATRAPSRPNPIGLSTVRLLRIEGPVLHVAELDLLDGTPVLDLKPYVPEFDAHPDARAGWLDTVHRRETADERFER